MMDRKIMIVGSAKSHNINKRRPRIRISGFWLNEIGFEIGSIVTSHYENGRITLKLEGKGLDTYNRVVKTLIDSNDSDLLQVRKDYVNNKPTPNIQMNGYWLDNYGFHIGSVIIVIFNYGFLDIRAIDIDNLAI